MRRREYEQQVEAVLQAGIDAGEFRDVDPWLTAMAWLGMHNYTYLWLKPGGRLSARDVARPFADIFLQGISGAAEGSAGTGGVAEDVGQGAADHRLALVVGHAVEQRWRSAPGCRGTCPRRGGSRCPTRSSTRR